MHTCTKCLTCQLSIIIFPINTQKVIPNFYSEGYCFKNVQWCVCMSQVARLYKENNL